MTKKLSIICPCFQESNNVDRFYAAVKTELDTLKDLDYEIIFIDDGSEDDSLQRINAIAKQDSKVRPYSFSRNFGHQVALTAGLDVANGDAVIMMDCDLQHPPELIPKMVALWDEGFDVVSAIRRNNNSLSLYKRLSSNVFYWLINLLSETRIIPGAADFCLLTRVAVDSVKRMPERHRFLRGMVSWIGFPRTFLEYDVQARQSGDAKYNTSKMLALALDGIFSFSTKPLRLAIKIGVALVAAGFAYLAYIIARYFLVADLVPGWASLISVILILGGIQLAFIGLIGEYLARIFTESKKRPLYLFKQSPEDVNKDHK